MLPWANWEEKEEEEEAKEEPLICVLHRRLYTRFPGNFNFLTGNKLILNWCPLQRMISLIKCSTLLKFVKLKVPQIAANNMTSFYQGPLRASTGRLVLALPGAKLQPNRLNWCPLQRLISLIEVAVVAKVEKASGSKDEGLEAVAEVMEDTLKIIESCKVSVPLF